MSTILDDRKMFGVKKFKFIEIYVRVNSEMFVLQGVCMN